jgi:ABC-type transport system substrate-binding protein
MEPLAAGDPESIGVYRLHARLGQGGMGRVYLGFSPAGRAVAVKIVRPELAKDAGFRRRFHTEVEAARRVSGAYTAPVIAAGPDDDPPWMATLFVPGPSLDDVVAAHGPLPLEASWKLAAGLIEAIQAVHGSGLVHRDLKPANVLLAEDGPRVIDFGISRALDGTQATGTNLVIGTAPFMSPEQAEGATVTPASDVFSLGAVIAFAATGAAPFGGGSTPSVLYRIVHAEPDIGGIPGGLRELVASCLVKEPIRRPGLPTLTEMIRSTAPAANISATSFWPGPVVSAIQAYKLTFAAVAEPGAPLPADLVADPREAVKPPEAAPPREIPKPREATHPKKPAPRPDTELDAARTRTVVRPSRDTPASPSDVTAPRARPGPPSPPRVRSRRLSTLKWVAGAVAIIVAAAVGTTVAMSGATSSGAPRVADSSGPPAYDAAITQIVNPSAHTGGTLTFSYSSTPDSFDPGNTYYAWVWNFSLLYATPLLTYRACPGSCGLQLAPGLATSLGQQSANGLTWTYHLKHGVTFEDGTPVTAEDIKYAVERTYARSVLPNGPSYFPTLLADPGYPGPYQDKAKNLMGLTSITTPDPYTIQFHLQKPFPDFNYVAALPQTAPVPPDKDIGANYGQHPLSTGPYMFSSYNQGAQLTLVRNPHWQQFYDPQARQLVSKVVLNLNVSSTDIDNQLLAGSIDVDAGGSGMQAAARGKILASTALKRNADDPQTGAIYFTYINTKVAPLDNVACRMAVEYAANKTAMQTAYGGPVSGGAIASTVLPPDAIGYQNFDLYETTTKPSGDLAKAKQELAACGHPNGFTTGMAYPSDSSEQAQAAQSLQASLARVGIKLQLHGYTFVNYYISDAGSPSYVHNHDLGLDMGDWAADWPDGYGFLDQISNGNAIVSSGNVNISELNDPTVNALFAQAGSPSTPAVTRTQIWGRIDRQIMSDAAILPGVYATALLYRNPDLTNVFVDPRYGMYDYAVLGVK